MGIYAVGLRHMVPGAKELLSEQNGMLADGDLQATGNREREIKLE